MSDNLPALLALDWGTSALRAVLMSAAGDVLARRERPWGILSLPEGGYPGAFAAITEAWAVDRLPAIACGMVGSRQGWRQVPYLTLPGDPAALAASMLTVPAPTRDGMLHLVPGLLDPAGPDVMRGEETEAVGALAALGQPDGALTLVMPGTHSKWLRVEGGVLTGFSTFMTGELFALLSRHSILAVPKPEQPEPEAAAAAAFTDGVRAAAEGLARRLFSPRARMLTGALDAGCVPDALSGLLIGDELNHNPLGPGDRVVLVGAPALTRRYALAFAALGRPAPATVQGAAERGLHRIALAAGLIHPMSSRAGETPC